MILLITPVSAIALPRWYVRTSGSDSNSGDRPQAAFATIARANQAVTGAGETIYVGPGTYNEGNIAPFRSGGATGAITFIADVSGANTGDAPGPVILRPQGAQTTGFLIQGRSFITIDGFTILGPADAGIQVRSRLGASGPIHSSHIRIVNCTVRQSAKRGVDVLAAGPVTIENTVASDNGTGGIAAIGPDSGGGGPFSLSANDAVANNGGAGILIDRASGVALADNRVEANSQVGLHVRRSTDVLIDRNTATENGQDGIRIDVDASRIGIAENFVVRNNTVTDNGSDTGDAGVSVLGGGTVAVLNNAISGSRGPGLSLESSTVPLQPTVQGNVILGSGADGILATSASGGEFDDNKVSNNQAGIKIRRAVGTQVRRNTVRANREVGIEVGSADDPSASSDVALTENTVTGNVQSGINVVGRGQLLVSDNDVRENGGAGVAVAGDEMSLVTLEENRVAQAMAEGIIAAGADELQLHDNQVEQSGETGIRASAIQSGSITGNTVTNSGRGGLELSADGDLEVARNDVRASDGVGILVSAAGDEMRATVSANRVRSSQSHGIQIAGSSGGSVSQNELNESASSGILIEDSVDTVVVSNMVSHSRDGIAVQSGRDVEVALNSVTESTNSGIVMDADGVAAITGNTVVQAGGAGIELGAATVEGIARAIRPQVLDNTLSGNGNGLFVQAAERGRIAGNQIDDSISDGILIHLSADLTIADNQLHRSGRNGIAVGDPLDLAGGGFLIQSNEIRESEDAGIRVFARGDVAVRDNQVTRSGTTGVTVETAGRSRVVATDNISGANVSLGFFARGAAAGRAQNNQIFSNGDSGLQLRDTDDFEVINNLIYANRFDGLAIGAGAGAGSRDTVIASNTIFANGAHGIEVGDESPRATIINNIIQDNDQEPLVVNGSSSEGLVLGFNVSPDTVTDPQSVSFDILAPAAFLDADGADNLLGGDGFADDDFHLQQVRAGQSTDSSGIDAGSAPIARIGLSGTTASNGLPDVDRIDVGFHYDSDGEVVVDTPAPFMPVYVRSSGSSENDGLDPARALASIRDAGLRAISGSTVIVGPGLYVNDPNLPVTVRSRAGRVTFHADPFGAFSGDEAGDVIVDANGGENGFLISGADDVTVEGFHVTDSTVAGIQIRNQANRAIVQNNIVFSNERRGVEVRDSDAAAILNNLVYDNGTGGIEVQSSAGSAVASNTVYGNGAFGILVGGTAVEVGELATAAAIGTTRVSLDLISPVSVGALLQLGDDPNFYRITAIDGANATIAPGLAESHARDEVVFSHPFEAPDTTVIRNIVAANLGGILVTDNSQAGYDCGGNVSPDGYAASTPRCEAEAGSDLVLDPELIDPDGADNILGGVGFGDDDFHLALTSPAIDLDPCRSGEVPVGTTRSDGSPDLCPFDSGYHYPITSN